MTDIKGKVVAITGASSGIGEAAGRLLAASGARVLLGARRADRLEAIAADIRKDKGEVDFHAIDVSRREDLASFVKKAQDRFGRLDVLISNAGLMPLSQHPSEGPYREVRSPLRFDATPYALRRHAPRVGEHTAEVLREAGVPAAEVDRLARRR